MRSNHAGKQWRLKLRRLGRGTGRVFRQYGPLLTLIILGLLTLWIGVRLSRKNTEAPSGEPDTLQVSVLNVGQGEASFFRTPEGRFVVIGTGPRANSARLIDALRAAGARSIDLLCVPYYADDAIGGFADLMNAFPIVDAVEPAGAVVNRLQDQFRTACVQHHINDNEVHVHQVIRIKYSQVRIDVDAPDTDPAESTPTPASNSLVLRVRYRKTAFLWAGGLDRAGENMLLGDTPDLSANWLRVARFGAADATSTEFLRLVSPDYAVISVGPNSNGYPSTETLSRISAAGAAIFSTDSAPNGLTFTSDGVQVFAPK